MSGVARTSPIGPQSQVQNAIAARSATCDTPADCPYSSGSTIMFAISSQTAKSATAQSGTVQPGNAASAISTGMPAPRNGPT